MHGNNFDACVGVHMCVKIASEVGNKKKSRERGRTRRKKEKGDKRDQVGEKESERVCK